MNQSEEKPVHRQGFSFLKSDSFCVFFLSCIVLICFLVLIMVIFLCHTNRCFMGNAKTQDQNQIRKKVRFFSCQLKSHEHIKREDVSHLSVACLRRERPRRRSSFGVFV